MDALIPAACAFAACGPAFFAVGHVTARRPFAPLVRGSLERCCVLVAAGIAASSITAQIGFFAAAFSSCEDVFEAVAWRSFSLAAPPTIAAATWCAGELLSGASVRGEAALGARLTPGASLGGAAAASALASAAAYFSVRGATRAR